MQEEAVNIFERVLFWLLWLPLRALYAGGWKARLMAVLIVGLLLGLFVGFCMGLVWLVRWVVLT